LGQTLVARFIVRAALAVELSHLGFEKHDNIADLPKPVLTPGAMAGLMLERGIAGQESNTAQVAEQNGARLREIALDLVILLGKDGKIVEGRIRALDLAVHAEKRRVAEHKNRACRRSLTFL
jgi:hypothetical protein